MYPIRLEISYDVIIKHLMLSNEIVYDNNYCSLAEIPYTKLSALWLVDTICKVMSEHICNLIGLQTVQLHALSQVDNAVVLGSSSPDCLPPQFLSNNGNNLNCTNYIRSYTSR